jgi:hypothetical protein
VKKTSRRLSDAEIVSLMLMIDPDLSTIEITRSVVHQSIRSPHKGGRVFRRRRYWYQGRGRATQAGRRQRTVCAQIGYCCSSQAVTLGWAMFGYAMTIQSSNVCKQKICWAMSVGVGGKSLERRPRDRSPRYLEDVGV